MRKNFKKSAAVLMAAALMFSLNLNGFAAEDGAEEAVGEEAVSEEVVDVVAPNEEDIAPAPVEVTASDALNVTRGTVVSNIFSYGQSLSGMTAKEAIKLAGSSMTNLMRANIVIKSEDTGAEYTTTAADLGISWDEDAMEAQINAAVLDGNIVERYKMAKDYQAAPVSVETGTVCDEGKIFGLLNEGIADWTSEPVNAEISALTGELVVTPGHNGCTYDLTNGVHQFVNDVWSGNIDSRKYEIDPAESITEPEFTTERLQGWSIIGKFTTEYAVPRTPVLANREQNLKRGIEMLTGRTFAPGETVSALDLYGAVTYDNGYRPAGTYISGGHQDEIGGGLCQVTTTLYNAVILAELDIAYRHNHSYLVNYIPPGLDAMVYPQGGSDFKFVNSSSDYIKLEGSIDLDTEFIHIWIIGHEDHAADHQVRYESELLGIIPAAITRVEDPSLGTGWGSRKFVKASDPINGAQARVWKVVTDGGVETRTLFTNTDTYKPMNCTINEAPDVEVVMTTNNSIDAYFTGLDTHFIDGTSIGANPATWSKEQRAAFNANMAAQMAAKGYTWPDSGSSFSFDGRQLIEDEMGGGSSSEEGEESGDGE